MIVIETPINTDVNFLIQDEETAESLIEDLEEIALKVKPNRSKTPAIEMPKESLTPQDFKNVLGLWANKEETGQEIASRIRQANRKQR